MESPQSRKRSACRALHTCHPQSLSKVDNPTDGFPTVSIRPVANKTAGLDERARENETLVSGLNAWVGYGNGEKVVQECERAVRGSNRLNGPLPSFLLSICGRQAAIPCMIVCMATLTFCSKPFFSMIPLWESCRSIDGFWCAFDPFARFDLFVPERPDLFSL
jgi:hypothetical protein